MNNKNTYISLFSSAGVGCFGFKEEDFQCVATNEFEEKRIAIQIANEKCKYPSGYICGDIKTDEVKTKIYNEIELWKSKKKQKKLMLLLLLHLARECQLLIIRKMKMIRFAIH